MQGLYDVSTIYVSINIFSLLHKHPVIQLQLARGRKKLLLFRWQSLDLERPWMYIWLYVYMDVYMDDNNNNNNNNNNNDNNENQSRMSFIGDWTTLHWTKVTKLHGFHPVALK